MPIDKTHPQQIGPSFLSVHKLPAQACPFCSCHRTRVGPGLSTPTQTLRPSSSVFYKRLYASNFLLLSTRPDRVIHTKQSKNISSAFHRFTEILTGFQQVRLLMCCAHNIQCGQKAIVVLSYVTKCLSLEFQSIFTSNFCSRRFLEIAAPACWPIIPACLCLPQKRCKDNPGSLKDARRRQPACSQRVCSTSTIPGRAWMAQNFPPFTPSTL